MIVLSYAYSGASRVQEALAAGTEMACTAGTGIIPLCEAAAEAWRRLEDRAGQPMSRLAVRSVQRLVMAQMTTILAGVGKTRWCELAATAAAGSFLQVFPGASTVCVHRSSLDVVGAGVRANPWGLQGPGLLPYLLCHPGNSVAALAAYWADATEALLAAEASDPGATFRVRYEDVAADPGRALAAIRDRLGLGGTNLPSASGHGAVLSEPAAAPSRPPQSAVPAGMIPDPLYKRISRLHAELGYPSPGN
ncbi:MAG: sulfotransferase [Streptosporangiaceae bacterium]|nr:sulfotransferase [Streptosporangiaceae bacterium]